MKIYRKRDSKCVEKVDYFRLFFVALLDEVAEVSLFELIEVSAAFLLFAPPLAAAAVPFSLGPLFEVLAAAADFDAFDELAFKSLLPSTDLDLLAAACELAFCCFLSAFSFSSSSAFSRSISNMSVLQRRCSSSDVLDFMNQSKRNCGA